MTEPTRIGRPDASRGPDGHARCPRRIRPAAFTLIELLVVVSIVAILVALLLPGLEAARNKARDVACSSQLQQIGVGLTSYASDNKGWFPNRGGKQSPNVNQGGPDDVDNANGPSQWGNYWNSIQYDRHAMIEPYVDPAGTACPFSERSYTEAWSMDNLSHNDSLWVWAGYNCYAGYRGRRDIGFMPPKEGPWAHTVPLRMQANAEMTLAGDFVRLVQDSGVGPLGHGQSVHFPGSGKGTSNGDLRRNTGDDTTARTGFSREPWPPYSSGRWKPWLADPVNPPGPRANFVHVDGHVSSNHETYRGLVKNKHNYTYMGPTFLSSPNVDFEDMRPGLSAKR